MYKPKFNHVLVEITESVEDKYSKADDGSLGGKVYREGKVVELGEFFATSDVLDVSTFDEVVPFLEELNGKEIMWNEGTEAGTVFEHDGKKYGLINWINIIGVKDGE
jgi:hypothetical protein